MFTRGATNRSIATSLLIVVLISTMLLSALSVGTAAAQGGGSGSATPVGSPPNGNPPGGAPPDGSASGAGSAESGSNPILTATCGAYVLDGQSDSTSDQSYAATSADQSAICVINSGTITLVNATVTKSGDTSSADQSSFYGLNAAVLASSGSSISLSGGSIIANGAGANGAFATGTDSTVTLADLSIEANGDGAHAVMATLGGIMTLTNVDMVTTGAHSGAVATDRGSGTITVTGGSVQTSGTDSPGIYSTGTITADGATITATGAEAAVIEGSNTITLNDVALTSSVANKWGVMLYQSFSGDAEGSDGTFSMTGGSLSYTAESGPLFFITNATGYINLSAVDVSATSGVLLNASATDRWGTSGANGGNAVLTADRQSLTGDLTADSISKISLTLQNSSTLTGAINADKSAAEANLTLDASSTWNVTADSYLTSLTLPDGVTAGTITNIIGNGYTVYYDAAANPALGGAVYQLSNGGSLQPLN